MDLLQRLRGRRATLEVVALAALALAFAIPAPGPGWNQNAHYALVRALAAGTFNVDRSRFEVGYQGTGDLSYYNGHYYASKPPGLAVAALPPFLLLKAAGDARPVPDPSKILWFLTLFTAALPTAVLLFLVRRLANDVAPGWGTAAAVTLGLGTMVLPFASLFFSHALSTALVFGAFALVWIERRRETRLRTLWLAGALATLAVGVEYQVALIGALIGVFAIARPQALYRGVAYLGGVLTAVIPVLLFNSYALGSSTHLTYANLASGSNKAGLFGAHGPRFGVAVELLFSSIGLITLMPIVVMGAVGLALVYRGGLRLEALIMGTIVVVYFLFNAGYETPFGGWSPGPRYLMPMLPFLGLPLAAAYRRFPLTTLALAGASAVEMVTLTATQPLWAIFGGWFGRFGRGEFVSNAFAFVGQYRLGAVLFLVLVVVAVLAAGLAAGGASLSVQDAAMGAGALLGWIVLAAKAPGLLDSNALGSGNGNVVVLLFALAIGLATALVPGLVASPGRKHPRGRGARAA